MQGMKGDEGGEAMRCRDTQGGCRGECRGQRGAGPQVVSRIL